MSIRQLEKLTLYGPAEQKRAMLDGLQQLGCMHLIPLAKGMQDLQMAAKPADLHEALAWLDRSPRSRRQIKNRNQRSVDEIVQLVLENKATYREVADARDKLAERIRTVRPWGDFRLPKLQELGGQRFWFYVLPLGDMETFVDSLASLKLPWEEIERTQREAYVIVISPDEPPESATGVPRSHVGMVQLSRLEQELEESEQLLEELLADREALTRWRYLLGQSIAAREDKAELEQALHGTLDESDFFLVQGWVAASEKKAIEHFCQQHGAAALFEKPQWHETPPTLLKKSPKTGGGADALGFFQTPNYHSWDPGNMVFFSFSLFFAMIMSDALYSLLFGGIVLLFGAQLRKSEEGTRLMRLAGFMSALGVVWGCMIGSYFGTSPPTGGLLDRIAFIELNDYNAMMKLSIVVGVLHLAFANIMRALANRHNSQALAPIGWAVVMVSGMAAWLGMTNTLPQSFAMPLGPIGMGVGALLVFLFSSARPIDSAGALFLRLLDGFKAIYNVTSAFGDVLSYMRLFALGLSGASLAMTFNSLADDVLQSSPVTGVLFSGLILLLGHTLNFALCIMSGVVHGMRLNVIEFVNWGLSDEGYPFKSYRKREDS